MKATCVLPAGTPFRSFVTLINEKRDATILCAFVWPRKRAKTEYADGRVQVQKFTAHRMASQWLLKTRERSGLFYLYK